jgi:hypothetical protein
VGRGHRSLSGGNAPTRQPANAKAEPLQKLGASDDALTQMLCDRSGAKVLARRVTPPTPNGLAREAVAIGEETDMVDAQGDTYADLGEVLSLADKTNEAAARATCSRPGARGRDSPSSRTQRRDKRQVRCAVECYRRRSC